MAFKSALPRQTWIRIRGELGVSYSLWLIRQKVVHRGLKLNNGLQYFQVLYMRKLWQHREVLRNSDSPIVPWVLEIWIYVSVTIRAPPTLLRAGTQHFSNWSFQLRGASVYSLHSTWLSQNSYRVLFPWTMLDCIGYIGYQHRLVT